MSYISYKAEDMGFDAHLTVLYLGDHEPSKKEHELFNEVLSKQDWPETIKVHRWFIDLFGPLNDIPVLRVQVPFILEALRDKCEALLGNGSEYKNWNPHITLELTTLNTIHLPHEITLTELSLS